MVLVLFLLPEMLYSDHIQDKYDTVNNALFNISLRCPATPLLMCMCRLQMREQ